MPQVHLAGIKITQDSPAVADWRAGVLLPPLPSSTSVVVLLPRSQLG
jgi:hypothetical protein